MEEASANPVAARFASVIVLVVAAATVGDVIATGVPTTATPAVISAVTSGAGGGVEAERVLQPVSTIRPSGASRGSAIDAVAFEHPGGRRPGKAERWGRRPRRP